MEQQGNTHLEVSLHRDENDIDADIATEVLCEVAETGNKATMQCLLDSGVNVNLRSPRQTTALHLATAANNAEMVQVLLQNGANVNSLAVDDFNNRRTPLFEAVSSGNAEIVQMLLEHGASIKEPMNYMEEAILGVKKIVQILLHHEADVHATKGNGRTPLHEAALDGFKSTVKLLLDHGVSLNFTTREGESVLHKASSVGCEELVRLLIDRGVNVNIVDLDDVTALHKASESGNSDIIRLLIENGAKINARTRRNGVTPLHRAVRSGNKSAVEILLKKGADVNSADVWGTSPLEIAVIEKQDDIAEVLLSCGASVNSVNANADSVLHQAISGGSREIILELLRRKANVNVVDGQGRSLLHLAVALGDVDIAEVLLEKGVNTNAVNSDGSPILHEAIEYGREETVLSLLNHGATVNACNFEGMSALHLALEKYNESMVVILLEHEANPNTVNTSGRSALHKATELENVYTVTSLLECGADVNYCDREGETPLLNAVEQNNVEIVKVLLSYGANVNDRNRQDQVPLHLTSSWCIAELLLANKAWANVRELYNGDTPLLTRAKSLTQSSYNFYQQHGADESPFVQCQQIQKKEMNPWIANNSGETVLGTLLLKHKFELALCLVEAMKETYGNCLNRCHTNGDTLLHVACNYEGQELIDFLLKSGAKVNVQNRRQETPLHISCRNANQVFTFTDEELCSYAKEDISDTVYFWTIRQLRAYGADPSVKESQGFSCFDLARHNAELLDLLTKPIELMEVPQLLKWSSKSDNHRQKVGQVVRGQRSLQVETFHYHTDPIGTGAFGQVYAGVDERDGREVAVKRLVKQDLCRPEDEREIRNLLELKDCDFIVKYLSCTGDQHFSYIILELMEGTLNEYMKIRTSTEQNISMCKDIIMGLNYLHNNKVLHRDIKPNNILYKTIPSLSLKIADFGLSIKTDYSASHKTTVLHTNAGTPCWMAPELLKTPGKAVKHEEESDIFACGLVLHCILAEQEHPFAPADFKGRSKVDAENAIQRNIMTNTFRLDSSLSAEAKHLVNMMLDEDNSRRPRTTVVLQHPFFWSSEKKVSFLCAVGNQTELEKPRHLVTSPSVVEQDLENIIGTEFVTTPWDLQIPFMYADMIAARHRRYLTSSAVELVRFIRNSYAHVSDAKRPTPMKKLLLEDFVFFDRFPQLVMVVYQAVMHGGWDRTREEIKYCLKQEAPL